MSSTYRCDLCGVTVRNIGDIEACTSETAILNANGKVTFAKDAVIGFQEQRLKRRYQRCRQSRTKTKQVSE